MELNKMKNQQVDEYMGNAPEEFRPLLSDLREKILKYFPEVEETFAYHIPVYRYLGKPIFSIAAFKDHYSIITQDKDIAEKIPQLADYKVSGTTVHFTITKPVTDKILRKIIQIRKADRERQ